MELKKIKASDVAETVEPIKPIEPVESHEYALTVDIGTFEDGPNSPGFENRILQVPSMEPYTPKIHYAAMKASHALQIEALLSKNYDEFGRLVAPEKVIDSDKTAWSRTGERDHSLFAFLPGMCICLTELKIHAPNGHANKMRDQLGIANNNLIPCMVQESTVFTREQLEEFSRLQLLARFPDESALNRETNNGTK